MTKTTALRKLIKTELDKLNGKTYYCNAPDSAAYPYKVYTFNNIDLGDISRDDIILTVDLWDKATDQKRLEEIADGLEDLLNGANLPQADILPTIWRSARRVIQDDDKDLQRIQLEFYIQNYKKGE